MLLLFGRTLFQLQSFIPCDYSVAQFLDVLR